MGGIIDKITDFIKEMLQGWVLDNLGTMFTDVNDKVGTIAGEVSKTPSTWNSGIFSMVRTLSENVVIPIAGLIISFVLIYELITMVIDKNNMHDFDTSLFFRFLFKACIAVMLLSKTFDIVMAVFDVGSHVVTQAASSISGSTSLDVEATLTSMFNSQIDTMGIGELIGLGLETMVISLCMKIMSVLITVILYGRMIEIYLYLSVPHFLESLLLPKQNEKKFLERQDIWIRQCIQRFCDDEEKMYCLFSVVSKLEFKRKKEYILFFLENNPLFEDFEKIPLTPTSWSWSGSAVPMYSAWIEFLKSLLPNCIGLKWIKHKNYIETKIGYLKEQIESEQIDEILRG